MKLALPFQLLADTDAEVSNLYGVYGEKVRCGKTSIGITRTTFIIDPKGKIAKVFKKVNVEDHAAEVLAVING
jgi:peroxiredoxin Q/BCP